MTIDILLYSDNGLEPTIGILGEFRLRYFHEFPYLYVGTEESEQGHMAEYLTNPSTRLLVARDGKTPSALELEPCFQRKRIFWNQRRRRFVSMVVLCSG